MSIFKDVKTDIDYLFPKSIRNYLPDDHKAWIFHDIFRTIDVSNITRQYSTGGREANNPLATIETIFYSSYQGIRSSRKIEEAMKEQIPYKIFNGDEIINFRRICEFRIRFKEEIKEIFVQVLLIAGRLEMIDLSSLFVDGSVIKANASKKHCFKKEKLEEYRKKLKKSVEKELAASIQEDKKEDKAYGEENPYLLSEGLKNKKKRLAKITEALNELNETGKDETNLTDKDSGKMKEKNGAYVAGYNPQLATTKDQFIISNDVTQAKSDTGAEKKVESEAKENIKKLKELDKIKSPEGKTAIVKDSAYYRVTDLEEYENDKDFEYYVPRPNDVKRAQEKNNEDEDKLPEAKYDRKKNVFICPAGEEIGYKKSYEDKKYGETHKYWDKGKCLKCKLRKKCLKEKLTYKIFTICGNIKLRNKMQEKMESEQAKELMKLRSQSVEPVYGDIKENNNFRSFLLRTLEKVCLEFSIMCTSHNIKLIINKIRQADQNYRMILGKI